jgi:hypothetical protein
MAARCRELAEPLKMPSSSGARPEDGQVENSELTGSVAKFSRGCGSVYDPTTGSSGWMMTIAFKGSHFKRDVILRGVRWYVAHPISYQQIEEMIREPGVEVDYSTLHRWVSRR